MLALIKILLRILEIVLIITIIQVIIFNIAIAINRITVLTTTMELSQIAYQVAQLLQHLEARKKLREKISIKLENVRNILNKNGINLSGIKNNIDCCCFLNNLGGANQRDS